MDKKYIENLIHLCGLQSTYGTCEDNYFNVLISLGSLNYSTYGTCKDNLLYLKPFLDEEK